MKTTEITMRARQRIKGPDGLILRLNAREVFPDDPGQGTPVIVEFKDGVSTFNCAQSEGEVEGYDLTSKQVDWLNDMEYAVDVWLTNWTRNIRRSLNS